MSIHRTQGDWLSMDHPGAKERDAVLLYAPDAADPRVMVGFWTEWEDGSANWTDVWTGQEIDTEPTHWMPCPQAPLAA